MAIRRQAVIHFAIAIPVVIAVEKNLQGLTQANLFQQESRQAQEGLSRCFSPEKKWYRGWGSNPGPLDPQSSALTN